MDRTSISSAPLAARGLPAIRSLVHTWSRKPTMSAGVSSPVSNPDGYADHEAW